MIERLTREAERNPAGYRRHVIWLVAQGYGYLLGALLVVLGLLALLTILALAAGGAAILVLKLAAPLLVIAIGIVRSMWVRIPEPPGRGLPLQDFPALQDLIESLRSRAKAPRLHQVLLTTDFNAAVVQIPRFGPFGGSRTYLILGLPLLMGLTVDELSSVLGHEFGHLSRSHGHFGAWIYRLRMSWFSLSSQLRNRPTSLGFFRSYFLKFIPRFDAATFVLARRHEYEADQMSTALVGAPMAAKALARHILLDRLIQDFWRSMKALNAETGKAPVDVDSRLASLFQNGVDEPTARAWLIEELRRPTDLDDTHPSFADRLHALGVEITAAEIAGPMGTSAADRLLGAQFLAHLQAEWSKAWHKDAEDRWRSDYERSEGLRRTYLDLKEKTQVGTLPPEQRGLYCALVSQYEGLEAGVRLARQEVEEHPDKHMVRLHLGMMLLKLDRPEGLDEIGFVAEREPALAVEECRHAYDWLFARGQVEDADAWHDAWSRCVAWREHGSAERSIVTVHDEFLPASLPEDLTRTLQHALGSMRGVRGAWFVRKKVTVLPSEVCQILFLWPGQAFLQDTEKRRQTMLNQLQKTLPDGNWRMLVLTPKLKPLIQKFDAIPGARLL